MLVLAVLRGARLRETRRALKREREGL